MGRFARFRDQSVMENCGRCKGNAGRKDPLEDRWERREVRVEAGRICGDDEVPMVCVDVSELQKAEGAVTCCSLLLRTATTA